MLRELRAGGRLNARELDNLPLFLLFNYTYAGMRELSAKGSWGDEIAGRKST